MLSVFLSHNHVDKPFARRLAERLKAHGVKVWLDEAEMQVGDSLFSKIESAIRECTYLGVIRSPRSVASPWVQREVNMALPQEIHGQGVKGSKGQRVKVMRPTIAIGMILPEP